MIVYGWNSFLLHECKPSQLGLSQDFDAVYQIERRQKYFHLFWIPFFGIGKTWVLRKRSDNQLYEPNGELLQVLNALPYQEKTPWYTFALPLLLLAGGIGFVIINSINDFQSRRAHEQRMAERVISFTQSVNAPAPNTYFTLRSNNYEDVYLKMISQNASTITCLYSAPSNYDNYDDRILEAFLDPAAIDTVMITKQSLVKAIDPGTESNFKGSVVVNNKGTHTLEDIKVIDYPVIRKTLVQFEEGTYIAMLQNIGATAKLKNFKAKESNITFEGSALPQEIVTGQSFIVNGKYEGMEPKANASVQFENADRIVKDYTLWINGTHFTLKQAN